MAGWPVLRPGAAGKGTGDAIAAWNLLFGGAPWRPEGSGVGKNSKPKRVSSKNAV